MEKALQLFCYETGHVLCIEGNKGEPLIYRILNDSNEKINMPEFDQALIQSLEMEDTILSGFRHYYCAPPWNKHQYVKTLMGLNGEEREFFKALMKTLYETD